MGGSRERRRDDRVIALGKQPEQLLHLPLELRIAPFGDGAGVEEHLDVGRDPLALRDSAALHRIEDR
jgi:hypothetical protein